MSQRNSGYVRMPGDTYITPRWVYEALYSVEPWACDATDVAPMNADFDFLTQELSWQDIATNPPFSLADKFCRHALKHARRVAMLLPLEFDAAKGRRDLFSENCSFRKRWLLIKRIRWENLVQKDSGPSKNHAWFIWDRNHIGPATMGWL